ncbi:MAG: two-component sensor histidine kinase [Streptomyces sp.]|jgi:signal transduction histidine kinase|uniref:sensor histidine kinase n=1 Tax=unclassified Streptomyces TaxID=2593676 RepID=UPI0025E96473|nr:histidine kinase [Streptomyces sp.]MBW8792095.1 two-component sensor histidine kinase [Streptomyces sp.]
MTAHRAAAPADPDRGTAAPPSPGIDAAWAHPLLGRMLRDRGRLTRLDRRHPWLFDTALVLAVALFSLPVLLRGGGEPPFAETEVRELPPGVLVACVAAFVVPLWWRRKVPAVTYFVIMSVSLVQWSLGIWLPAGVAALIALYTVARTASLRLLGWAAALTVVEAVLAVSVLVPVEHPLLSAFFLLGTATAAVATGLTLRIRQMYLAALEDRARRLEIEHEQRVRLTAAAERSRVAREMHDIVGHNLSVMVSVADGAATLAANRNERSADALRILGDTGRQAMSELRRVLGVLREERGPDEDARPLSPQPGIRDLDPLLARVRAAGLPVTYRTVGDLDALSSGVQLTVYRIVQESLTNSLKHAGTGTSAEVTLAAGTGDVRVKVADTGTPPGAPAPAKPPTDGDGPGHGLVGIRQRAAMFGGTVIIGPRDTGHGWLVDVVLDVPPGDPLP